MKLETFVEENRQEIDAFIHTVNPNSNIDNEERENWVMNDEALYNWARSEGVNI